MNQQTKKSAEHESLIQHVKNNLKEAIEEKNYKIEFRDSPHIDFVCVINGFSVAAVEIIMGKNFNVNKVYKNIRKNQNIYKRIYFISQEKAEICNTNSVKDNMFLENKLDENIEYIRDDLINNYLRLNRYYEENDIKEIVKMSVDEFIENINLSDYFKNNKYWNDVFNVDKLFEFGKDQKIRSKTDFSKGSLKDNSVGKAPVGDKIIDLGFDKILFRILRIYTRFDINGEIRNKKIRTGWYSVYRYCGIDTPFQIIKNKTYRINGIPGMNDQTEGNNTFFRSLGFSRDVELLNRTFISSCTLRNDDLTMWRLYGDDSKGVQLDLSIKYPKIDDELLHNDQGFYLCNVVYEDGIFNEMLIKMTENIRNYGWEFDFKFFEILSFFIKNEQYKDEKEYRILYLLNDPDLEDERMTWNISNSYGIPFKSIDIHDVLKRTRKSNTSPFFVKKIILGPNCPNKDNVINQFNYWKNLEKLVIDVVPSKIHNDVYIVDRKRY